MLEKIMLSLMGILSTVTLIVIGWGNHLGNRVTSLETKEEGLHLLLQAYFEPVHQRLDHIERILNGHFEHNDD